MEHYPVPDTTFLDEILLQSETKHVHENGTVDVPDLYGPWDTLPISLSEQNIYGTPILPTNRLMQVRAIISGAVQAAKVYMEEKGDSEQGIQPSVGESAASSAQNNPAVPRIDFDVRDVGLTLKDIEKFAHSFRRIDNTQLTVQTVLPFPKAIRYIYTAAALQNNPIVQSIQKMYTLNSLRKSAYGTDSPDGTVFSEKECDQLSDDVIKVAFAPLIKSLYDELWTTYRKQYKAAKNAGSIATQSSL